MQWIDQLHGDINCTAYLHDLLDFVLHSLLNPSPLHRAKCPEVVEKLHKMREQCTENEEYYLNRVPKMVSSTPPEPYRGEIRMQPVEIPPTPKILEKEQLFSSPRHSLDSNASLVSSLRSERISSRPDSPQRRMSVRFKPQDKATSSTASIDGLDEVLENEIADARESANDDRFTNQPGTRLSSDLVSPDTGNLSTIGSSGLEEGEKTSLHSVHKPGNITQKPLGGLNGESVEHKTIHTSNGQVREPKGRRGGILSRGLARVNLILCKGSI